jgi:hypothetical protein
VATANSSPYIDSVSSKKGVYYYRVAKSELYSYKPQSEYKEYSSSAMVIIQP